MRVICVDDDSEVHSFSLLSCIPFVWKGHHTFIHKFVNNMLGCLGQHDFPLLSGWWQGIESLGFMVSMYLVV